MELKWIEVSLLISNNNNNYNEDILLIYWYIDLFLQITEYAVKNKIL